MQILNIHTTKMREYGKLAPDVDVVELGTLTKNFSGAELEGLVRAAQSSAMNRLVKVRLEHYGSCPKGHYTFFQAASKVEIDPNAIEKLQVNRDDFMYALANDVKPVSTQLILSPSWIKYVTLIGFWTFHRASGSIPDSRRSGLGRSCAPCFGRRRATRAASEVSGNAWFGVSIVGR